jgi:hypothetical protein
MFFLGHAHALHGEKGVLWATVSFFTNPRLFSPKIAVDGVALRHFVVAIALGEIHTAAIGEFPQQREDLPLDISGRAFGRITEEDLVLDLETAQLRVEYGEFLV